MKMRSLRVRLSFSYALIALLLVASVSLFSNLFLQDAFVEYVIRQQLNKNEAMVSQLAQRYDQETEAYDAYALESIGMNALEQGMILRVKDSSGAVVWDAMVHNGGLCNQMLQNMAQSMQNRYPSFQGAYEEKSYAITAGGADAGSVQIGYYGPYYFTDSDFAFIDTLNRALLVIGIFSLAFAGALGFFMARRISRPISQAIGAAGRIAAGNYRDKIDVRADTRELDGLVQSINRLSGALEEQDMLRKRLTADIAHELRTPLTALQGNMEALIDGVWQPEQRRFLSCHEEILRLNRLINDLENLSRLENHTEAPVMTEFDLYALAEKAAASFELACREKNQKLTVQGSSLQVKADESKLFQVLSNLIANSVKYTPAGGEITVNVEKEAGYASLSVQDTGIGIAPEDIPYVFERFYRADTSRSSRTGGIGVGLAIVKAIVDMHGGTIGVQSMLGRGSIFTVRLPRE